MIRYKCPYCHFYVIPENDTHKKKLLKYLKVEWDLVKDATLNKTLRSVYFGGGTPSLLSPEEISEITSLFPISKDTEVTLECNPEGVTFSKLKGFKKAGINRLSIGIQTFSNSLLQELEREHSAEEGKKIVTLSNDAGFENITIDLMYDLPSQDNVEEIIIDANAAKGLSEPVKVYSKNNNKTKSEKTSAA